MVVETKNEEARVVPDATKVELNRSSLHDLKRQRCKRRIFQHSRRKKVKLVKVVVKVEEDKPKVTSEADEKVRKIIVNESSVNCESCAD